MSEHGHWHYRGEEDGSSQGFIQDFFSGGWETSSEQGEVKQTPQPSAAVVPPTMQLGKQLQLNGVCSCACACVHGG